MTWDENQRRAEFKKSERIIAGVFITMYIANLVIQTYFAEAMKSHVLLIGSALVLGGAFLMTFVMLGKAHEAQLRFEKQKFEESVRK